MNSIQLINLIKRKWQTIATLAVLGVFLGLVVSVVEPVRYSSTMQLLILQRYAFARDAYTASKSIEYLSNVFGEVMYSQSFINEVLSAGYPIKDSFSLNAEKAKKQWKKMVKTRVSRDNGIINVTVYNGNPTEAKTIAEAIQYVLANKGDQYHGEGDRVVIRTLDAPQVPSTPVEPNIPVNALAGALLTVIVGFTAWISGRDWELTPESIWRALVSEQRTPQSSLPLSAGQAGWQEHRVKVAEWLDPQLAYNNGNNEPIEDSVQVEEPGEFEQDREQ